MTKVEQSDLMSEVAEELVQIDGLISLAYADLTSEENPLDIDAGSIALGLESARDRCVLLLRRLRSVKAASPKRRMSLGERQARQADYDDEMMRQHGPSLEDRGLVDGYRHGGF